MELSWPADASTYLLEQTTALDGSPWEPVANAPVLDNGMHRVTISIGASEQYFRLRASGEPLPATISSLSPEPGENGVSVTRETIIEFSAPLNAGATVDLDRFHAEFGGRRLLSRVELSSDRRRATLFYLEPLPAGARVRVTFTGDDLLDTQGLALDADGDGTPGGTVVFDFDTMSTSEVPGTVLVGQVFAAELVDVGGGVFTNKPLEGVLVTVDGAEQDFWTMTEADGSFRLDPSPAGRFFVKVDGRTALGSDWPDGSYYPVVGKTFEAVPGQTNLANGDGQIFLPLIAAGTLQEVSATEETVVTFPPEVLAANPALAGVTITVPPNSLFSDDGTRGGQIGIAPVPSDRIPSPLPPGLEFPLVFTIQTDGGSNFDQPVAVRFPNLPDPNTGEKAPPGTKLALWSYNHDTGRWEVQGSMTVTPDGNFVETDPGVGIRQPGWHSLNPGSDGEDGGGDDDPRCKDEWGDVEEALFGCALGAALELAELAPGLGCAISISSSIISIVTDCADPETSCAASLVLNSLFGAAGCVPGLGLAAGTVQCALSLGTSLGGYSACEALASGGGGAAAMAAGFPEDPLEQQILVSGQMRDLLAAVLGGEEWVVASATDAARMRPFGEALVAALEAGSEEGMRLSSGERTGLLALDPPAGLTLEIRSALLDRFDRFAAGGMTPTEAATIENAANALSETLNELSARGWLTTADGLKQAWREGSLEFSDARQDQPLVQRRLYYRLADLEIDLVRYGRTEDSGEVVSLPLIANREYQITYLDPQTLNIGTVLFVASDAGFSTSIPRARLVPVDGADADGDGLMDIAETIVGTSRSNPDSDDDGVFDLEEIQQGLNPLDGLPLTLGVLANVPLNGEANAIEVEGTLAYLATGRHGLAIVDLADPLQPRAVSELELPGDSFEIVVEPRIQVAALVARSDGAGPSAHVHFVDVSDPGSPLLKSTYGSPILISDLELADGFVLVAMQRDVRIYDPGSGLEVGSFQAQAQITGLMAAGDRLFVATTSALEIFDTNWPLPTRLGRFVVPLPAPDIFGHVQMALDGNRLFLGRSGGNTVIDVSDPAAMVLLAQPETRIGSIRSLKLSGGGNLVTMTSFSPTDNAFAAADLAIYDVTESEDANTLLFSMRTLGRGRDLELVSGFAAIADVQSGLTVMNYLGPDTAGDAPVVTLAPESLDVDAAAPGIQVRAGNRVIILPQVADDIETRTTELLVNGEVVQTTATLPLELEFRPPLLKPGSSSETLTLQIRSTDRGRNISLSELVTVEVIPDTVAPELVASMPFHGGAAYATEPFILRYSNEIDPTTVDTARIRLTSAGPDGVIGGGDDATVPLENLTVFGSSLVLAFSGPLAEGRYELTLGAALLASVGGVATPSEERIAFTAHDVAPGTALWVSDDDGAFSDLHNWVHRRLPIQEDIVINRFLANPVVTVDWSGFVGSFLSAESLLFENGPNLQVLENFETSEDLEMTGGDLGIMGDALFGGVLAIRGGEVQVSGRFETQDELILQTGGALTFSGPDAVPLLGGPVQGVNFTLMARDGALISWPGFVDYQDPGDFTSLFPRGTRFVAQGFGSSLALTDIESANGPVDWNARGIPSVTFEAVSGGQLSLSSLETLTGRTILRATGSGGLLVAPQLTSIVGPEGDFGSSISVGSGATIRLPELSETLRVEIEVDEGGVLDAPLLPE